MADPENLQGGVQASIVQSQTALECLSSLVQEHNAWLSYYLE